MKINFDLEQDQFYSNEAVTHLVINSHQSKDNLTALFAETDFYLSRVARKIGLRNEHISFLKLERRT
jgi:lipoprotein NlpI